VLMRTRYLAECEELLAMGARDAVAEEVESAVEVIARMLRSLETPRNVIDESIADVRSETKPSIRPQTVPRSLIGDVRGLDELKIESALVRDGSAASGRSPAGLNIRSVTGALVVGVRREEQLLEQPDPTVPFQPGDIVYFVGTRSALARALRLFEVAGPEPAQ
jgi:CPA2 family monovalent cation:H+ antiporter-2